MLVISYDVTTNEYENTYHGHNGKSHSVPTKDKQYQNITFSFEECEDSSDDEYVINQINDIMENNTRGRIKRIKELLEEDEENELETFDFDNDEQQCIIKYNSDIPKKLYIQIWYYTDEYCCYPGSYHKTIPTTVAFSKEKLEISSQCPIIKYVYNEYSGSYVEKKRIYKKWD